MRQIKVFTDTGSDMIDELKEKGVGIIPLYITFDGNEYLKQMVDIDIEEFYKRLMEQHEFHPKTSLASIQDYIDAFETVLKEEKDVLYLVMNGCFSNTYGAAMNAKNILQEKYPESRIEVVDTMTVTYGQYYLTNIANDMAKSGADIDEIIKNIESKRSDIKFYFTVETLNYLKLGGRIGKVSALLGEMLNIKPVIEMHNGELLPITKVRGRKKSLACVLDKVKEEVGSDLDSYDVTVVSAKADDELEYYDIVKDELGMDKLGMCKLGISIGLHAGPGTLGISVIKK